MLGNVLVNAEDQHEAHGRCRVSEDERSESATWEKSCLPYHPGLPGSAAASDCCYLKETKDEDELGTCQVPEGQGDLMGN